MKFNIQEKYDNSYLSDKEGEMVVYIPRVVFLHKLVYYLEVHSEKQVTVQYNT